MLGTNSMWWLSISYMSMLVPGQLMRLMLPQIPITVYQMIAAVVLSQLLSTESKMLLMDQTSEFNRLGVSLFILLNSLKVEVSLKEFSTKFIVFGLAVMLLMIINFTILLIPIFDFTVMFRLSASVVLSFTATPILMLYLKYIPLSPQTSKFALDYTVIGDVISWVSLFLLVSINRFEVMSLAGLTVTLSLSIIISKLKFKIKTGLALTTFTICLAIALISISSYLIFPIGTACLLVGMSVNQSLISDGLIDGILDMVEVIFVPLIFIDLSTILTMGDISVVRQLVLLSLNFIATWIEVKILCNVTGASKPFLLSSLLNCGGIIQIVAISTLVEYSLADQKLINMISVHAILTTTIGPVLVMMINKISGDAKHTPEVDLRMTGNLVQLTINNFRLRDTEPESRPTIIGAFENPNDRIMTRQAEDVRPSIMAFKENLELMEL